MKRFTAVIMSAVMLIMTSCGRDSTENKNTSELPQNPSEPTQDTSPNDSAMTNSGNSASNLMRNVFLSTAKFEYDGVPNVPSYSVAPNLKNIANINQFVYDTDRVGNFYFGHDLSDEAMSAIEKNGFVVIDGANRREYYGTYESNRYSYVPSFITTDSTVHTFHLMYDHVLKDIEQNKLRFILARLSNNMEEASYQQYLSLKGTSFENAAKRNMAFFSVGSKLLDSDYVVKDEVVELVEHELSLITGQSGVAESYIINYGQQNESNFEPIMVDYSQYTPRGHYTQTPELTDYFKATMWYGQITFRSIYADEVRSALLMTSASQTFDNLQDWYTTFETINFFVGECDDITMADYLDNLSAIYGSGISDISVVTDEMKFEQALALIRELPPPAINSIPIFDNQADRSEKITGLRFLGQRFTLDAAIFQHLIYPEIKERYLPNSLDIPAALGSSEAYNILRQSGELESYPEYDNNLSDVKTYIENLPDEVWNTNLYWSWLNMLRPLISNNDRTGYPFFMQNSAWIKKEINTFQGSWTELKHDTLLYSKQNYAESGDGSGDPPSPPDDRGYVEPNPELFGRLAILAKQARDGLTKAGLITDEANESLANLYDIANQLATIAEKELSNTELNSEEYIFIREYGAKLEHIWNVAKKDELKKFWNENGKPNMEEFSSDETGLFLVYHPDAVVADVATDPNGLLVLEEATGFAKTIIVAIPRDDEVVLSRGVVYSQYEFIVPIEERMTDETWHETLNTSEYSSDNGGPQLTPWKWDFSVNY